MTSESYLPFSKVCEHLHAVHAYADDPSKQVEAHHYCHCIAPNQRQCLLYDSDAPNARLIGVEYMVDEALFKTFDAEEKKMWHSHVFEIQSGMLVLVKPPLVPEAVWEIGETKALEPLLTWYGKVYHFCEPGGMPFGPPRLMTSVVKEELLDKELIEKRNKRMGIDMEHKRKIREHFVTPELDPGADRANEWLQNHKNIQ